MPTDEVPPFRSEMIALLGRIVGEKPLPPDLQRTALDIFAALVAGPGELAPPMASTLGLDQMHDLAAGGGPSSASLRRLVYVHGICQHAAGFSDSWWDALHPFVPMAFGAGIRGETRLEVVWSDIVNASTEALAAMAGTGGQGLPDETIRAAAAAEIKDALRDRADQQIVNANVRASVALEAPVAAGESGALLDIPLARCVDDFAIYLTNDAVRQQIVNRFLAVVRPRFHANEQLDVIGHSWGSVVAYEGLRQLEVEGVVSPFVRNFFTVGAALSIGAVKSRLRVSNRDGKKPACVRRWVNLDARGDLIGGPLKNRPYQVDFDFVNVEPFGCGVFLGLINPSCAHSSYFQTGNSAVNRGIFGRFIAS